MERRLNKKLILILIKYGTWFIGLVYFIQAIFACFGFQSFALTVLFSVSVIPNIIICLFSYMLGFCFWNRLPLYYVMLLDIINIFDIYIGFSITNKWMLMIYLFVIIIFILIGIYVEKRNIKESIT